MPALRWLLCIGSQVSAIAIWVRSLLPCAGRRNAAAPPRRLNSPPLPVPTYLSHLSAGRLPTTPASSGAGHQGWTLQKVRIGIQHMPACTARAPLKTAAPSIHPLNNPPSLPHRPAYAAYFEQREKQLVTASIIAVARGSSAWRPSVCVGSSELLLRRGRRPLLLRVPRRMTGVNEADSRVLYICCVAVPCSPPEPAWPPSCVAAAAEQGCAHAAAPALQRAASAPTAASLCAAAAAAAEQAALERLGTPPVTAEYLPAAKRSRRQEAVGLSSSGALATQAQPSLEHLLDCCTSSPCCSWLSPALQAPPAAVQPSLVAGPAVLPLPSAGRSAGAGSPLDRLVARVKSLLSPLVDTCPTSAS